MEMLDFTMLGFTLFYPTYNFLNGSNKLDCYPVPALVLIDGGGMKPGAINWLKTQVNTNKNLLAVYDLSSFIAWANNNNL